MSSLGRYYLKMLKINHFEVVDVVYYKKEKMVDTIQKSEKSLMKLDSMGKSENEDTI
jgi:hypothetical protein